MGKKTPPYHNLHSAHIISFRRIARRITEVVRGRVDCTLRREMRTHGSYDKWHASHGTKWARQQQRIVCYNFGTGKNVDAQNHDAISIYFTN